MAVNSEKIELLGKGLYDDIPNVLTLQSIPTASELELVSAEDFEATMLDSILPQAVQEKIDFRKLLEIDFHWICRALRILNYGPYFTTNVLFCSDCGESSHGEFNVDLRTIDCNPLPDKFINDVVVSKDEFIDFNEDIHIKLLTIQEMLNADKDESFTLNGKHNRSFARLCYSITSVGTKKDINPVEAKILLSQRLSDADYKILKNKAAELTDFGLRAAGTTICPKCHKPHAAFLALVDDKFFRPTMGDLRKWRDDRRAGGDKKSA